MTRQLLISVLLIWGSGAIAQTCEAPATPNCLATSEPFEDQTDMNNCQSELSEYRNLVTDFAGCLRAQARGVQEDAAGLAKKFRCRAGMEGSCN